MLIEKPVPSLKYIWIDSGNLTLEEARLPDSACVRCNNGCVYSFCLFSEFLLFASWSLEFVEFSITNQDLWFLDVKSFKNLWHVISGWDVNLLEVSIVSQERGKSEWSFKVYTHKNWTSIGVATIVVIPEVLSSAGKFSTCVWWNLFSASVWFKSIVTAWVFGNLNSR